jgi:hypothetical protein
MRIVIEDVTGTTGETTVQRIRRQVFEREMGLELPKLTMGDDAGVLHLLARTESGGDPAATLSVVDTSGDHDLVDRYGLEFDARARTARYAQLAVLKPYRGMSIPLMMIIEGQRRFVMPRQIQYTWLLFDAGRAATSSMCKLLAFIPGERILESEYGKRRALLRNEMAPESLSANRAAEGFLQQFARFSLSSPPESSSAKSPNLTGSDSARIF